MDTQPIEPELPVECPAPALGAPPNEPFQCKEDLAAKADLIRAKTLVLGQAEPGEDEALEAAAVAATKRAEEDAALNQKKKYEGEKVLSEDEAPMVRRKDQQTFKECKQKVDKMDGERGDPKQSRRAPGRGRGRGRGRAMKRPAACKPSGKSKAKMAKPVDVDSEAVSVSEEEDDRAEEEEVEEEPEEEAVAEDEVKKTSRGKAKAGQPKAKAKQAKPGNSKCKPGESKGESPEGKKTPKGKETPKGKKTPPKAKAAKTDRLTFAGRRRPKSTQAATRYDVMLDIYKTRIVTQVKDSSALEVGVVSLLREPLFTFERV